MQFKKRRNGDTILRELKGVRIIKDQAVSIRQTGVDWVDILASAVEPPKSLDREIFHRAVRRAVFSVDLQADFSPKDFFGEVSRCAELEKRRKEEDYVFLFSLTGLNRSIWGATRNRKAYATFAPSKKSRLNKRIFFERAELRDAEIAKDKANHFNIPSSETGLSVKIKTSGINHYDAYRHASDLLDFERGLANFVNNRHTSWRSSSPPSPVNYFLELPFTTVHKPNGELSSRVFWYQPDWPRAKLGSIKNDRYDYLERNYKKLKNLQKNQ